MRYQSAVTDFIHEPRLTHLSATEARLSTILGQPQRLALGTIAALVALGWGALALMAARTGSWSLQTLCQVGAAGSWRELAVIAPMWMAMTLVMMLPTAGPMILTYSEIADTAARKGEPVVPPLVLTLGYVAVWIGFALCATILQSALSQAGLLGGGSLGRVAGGVMFITAGLYQFSNLKQACLTQCQRPFPFFFANWTTERAGVLRLGVRQGGYCLGCCWAMMLLMFAVGVMNVVWMAGLGVLMTIEKMTTTPRLSRALGAAFVVAGLTLLAVSVG